MLSAEQALTKAWYSNSSWLVLLRPLAWLFNLVAQWRRRRLQSVYQGQAFTSPVVVIGNISVGGSGKTPLIIALVKALNQQGYSVGVVSRGFGARAESYPLAVTDDVAASQCGDEPLLIARSCDCPVVVDPDRVSAVNYLLAEYQCDLILSDDGLQHYRLHRDIEIAVVDGTRGLGNQRSLPAGPLREPPQRLQEVDYILLNGGQRTCLSADLDIQQICLQASVFRHLASGESVPVAGWKESTSVHAVAAIGNPQRFAATLAGLGLDVDLRGLDDHRQLSLPDLSFEDDLPVIITAKDAVKFTAAAADNVWVLEVDMCLPDGFVNDLIAAAGLGRDDRTDSHLSKPVQPNEKPNQEQTL